MKHVVSLDYAIFSSCIKIVLMYVYGIFQNTDTCDIDCYHNVTTITLENFAIFFTLASLSIETKDIDMLQSLCFKKRFQTRHFTSTKY